MFLVTALDTEQINDASTALNNAIQKYGATDSHVRALQQWLDYAVMRPFQAIRKAQLTNKGRDIPVGFLRLSETDHQSYDDFKEPR